MAVHCKTRVTWPKLDCLQPNLQRSSAVRNRHQSQRRRIFRRWRIASEFKAASSTAAKNGVALGVDWKCVNAAPADLLEDREIGTEDRDPGQCSL